MRTISLLGATGAVCVALLQIAPAQAQATRTWVSGVGDDVNPCSRTAPCKTFAGAISKTAPGGEISVLDPGGFGVVTITKAITINGEGTLAGILSAGSNGINVAAAAADKVILRNLSINGATTGLNGIRFTSGGQLTVDKVTISGVTGFGIDVSHTAGGELYVRDTNITKANTGIRLSTTAGALVASIDNVRIDNMSANGIDATTASVFATVSNSVVTSNTAIAVGVSSGSSQINVDNSTLINNGTAVSTSGVGSTIRISRNNIYNNTVGLSTGGGTIATSGNNNTGANTTPGTTNGTVTPQ
jgi:hypothetical protein